LIFAFSTIIMNYQLNLPQYTGPLEKLLELIEERKMEVTQISLAQVTDDFIRHLKTLAEAHADLRLISDFISVASRLIFIKSKFILPDLDLTPDEEGAAKDLEIRLRLYQELKPIIRQMARLWKTNEREWARPFLLDKGFSSLPPEAKVFYPGGSVDMERIVEALNKLFESVKSIILETETIEQSIVTLEEKIEEIIRRLEESGESSFKNLYGARSRIEVITIFLAILHLAREQRVHLEQIEHFSDIIIKTPVQKIDVESS